MARTADEITVIVEFDGTREPVDPLALADQVARDLETDAVARWAERVRSAVAQSRDLRLTEASTRTRQSGHQMEPAGSRIAVVRRQIAALEEELVELEHTA